MYDRDDLSIGETLSLFGHCLRLLVQWAWAGAVVWYLRIYLLLRWGVSLAETAAIAADVRCRPPSGRRRRDGRYATHYGPPQGG